MCRRSAHHGRGQRAPKRVRSKCLRAQAEDDSRSAGDVEDDDDDDGDDHDECDGVGDHGDYYDADDDVDRFLTSRISKRAKMNSAQQPAKPMPKFAKLEARLPPLWRRRMPLEEKLKKRGKACGRR
jgi:hypothetical protein